jgi:site-specific DNA recombinase
VVAAWIADTQAHRQRATTRRQQDCASPPHGQRLTADQITAIFDELGDLVTALREADPDDKVEVYRNVGLQLTYNPHTQTTL